jgi:hypothetical protein
MPAEIIAERAMFQSIAPANVEWGRHRWRPRLAAGNLRPDGDADGQISGADLRNANLRGQSKPSFLLCITTKPLK